MSRWETPESAGRDRPARRAALARFWPWAEPQGGLVARPRDPVMRRLLQRGGQLVGARSRSKNQIDATLWLPDPSPLVLGPVRGKGGLARRAGPAGGGARVGRLRPAPDRGDRGGRALDLGRGPRERRGEAADDGAGRDVICAATFMAAVGEIGRFPSTGKLAAYLGLDRR